MLHPARAADKYGPHPTPRRGLKSPNRWTIGLQEIPSMAIVEQPTGCQDRHFQCLGLGLGCLFFYSAWQRWAGLGWVRMVWVGLGLAGLDCAGRAFSFYGICRLLQKTVKSILDPSYRPACTTPTTAILCTARHTACRRVIKVPSLARQCSTLNSNMRRTRPTLPCPCPSSHLVKGSCVPNLGGEEARG